MDLDGLIRKKAEINSSYSEEFLEFLGKGIRMAIENTDESWNWIDETFIPTILEKDVNGIAVYAIRCYRNDSGEVRDLAGTITANLEVDNLDNYFLEQLKFYTVLGTQDEHKFARFRATIAAIKHSWYETSYLPTFRATLTEIINTEQGQVAELANEYLAKID